VSAARTGNPSQARADLVALEALRKATEEKKDPYWVSQIEILRLSAEAWILLEEGKREEAERVMRSSADLEDATDKHPVTPGSLIPAREMLGSLLLEMNRPAEALKEFEASLASTVSRLNGLYGAARAAELSGDRVKARKYSEQILNQCSKADDDVPQVQHAQKMLAKN